ILRNTEEVRRAKNELPQEHRASHTKRARGEGPEQTAALILERFVPFTRELSILAVRGRTGETAVYPLIENHHRGGILRLSLAPASGLDSGIQPAAEDAARRILESLH